MNRHSLLVLAGMLASLGSAGRVDAGFIHTFNTNAMVTIADGDFSGTGPPRDGIPDTFYPDGRPPGVLNAFYGFPPGPNNREHRAVLEFDIGTLAGIDLTSATLRLFSTSTGGNVSLSSYYGDGQITLDDWSRLDFFVTTLPGSGSVDVDVRSFLQSAIDTHQNYAGFVIWQAPSQASNGRTYENGGELVLAADRDFGVPAPLEPPPYPGSGGSGGGGDVSAVPEPSSLALSSLGIGTLLIMLRGRRQPRIPS